MIDHFWTAVDEKAAAKNATPAIAPSGDINGDAGPAIEGIIRNLLSAPEFERNHRLNWAAYVCGGYIAGGHLKEEDVRDRLVGAGLAIGLTALECKGTVASGLRSGAQHPRHPNTSGGWDTTEIAAFTPTEAAIQGGTGKRRLALTPASSIKPRPVFWLWHERFALGSLGLLAGREGMGKSTIAYWIAGQVTRGELPGKYLGNPKSVIVGATEDSWEHTIVPRLIAADANLDRIYRVDVYTADDILTGLVLPRDVNALEQAIAAHDVALVLLDPLSSRLDDKTDSHKDPDVRRALEPLVAIADRTAAFVLGLAHHNKSGSDDPLTLVLGSRAFTAVARSVSVVVRDPDDETEQGRLFGTPKNNLGRDDLPSIRYRIIGKHIDTDEGPASTGAVEWLGESERSIRDAINESSQDRDERSATGEAAEWLADHMVTEGGRAASADIKRDALKAGHTYDALKRARRKIGLSYESVGFPRATYWLSAPSQSEQHSRSSPGESAPTALTALTVAVGAVGAVRAAPTRAPQLETPMNDTEESK